MVTNVELTADGSEHWFNWHSRMFANEYQFLKDVRYCPEAGWTLWWRVYRIYGTLVSADDFKEAVEAYIASSSNKHNSVLYQIHGFNVEPKTSFKGVYGFTKNHGDDTNILGIPISWRNVWEAHALSYEYDRNELAPRAGRQLAAKFSAFSSSAFPTSIMCHSMGNYVFRVFAQNVGSPSHVFDNLYMVAAGNTFLFCLFFNCFFINRFFPYF